MEKFIKVFLNEGDYWETIEKKMKSQLSGLELTQLKLYDIRNFMISHGFFRIMKNEDKGIRFVGGFQINIGGDQIEFWVLPKYLKDTCVVANEISLIIKAIEKTGYLYDYVSEASFTENKYNSDYKRITQYNLAKWIINDYSMNGIFYIKERKCSSISKGRINWDKTVTKKIPYIDEDDVFYHNPLNTYIKRNDSILLSEIHRCAVREAISYIEKFGEAETVIWPDCNTSMLGKLQQYSGVVKTFQRTVFSNRDITLLRALEAWCGGYSKYYELPVGTVSFEKVWEDCLREVFGNIPKNFSFGSPEYRLGTGKQQVDNDSIPDIINISKDNDNEVRFLLLDAKYYLGEILETKRSLTNLKNGYQWIHGLPGYKDIAKQFDYYQTLRCEYGIENGLNAFLLPWYDIAGLEGVEQDEERPKWCRYLGYAYKGEIEPSKDSICEKLESLGVKYNPKQNITNSSGKKVLVVQIDPNWLYGEMLNQRLEKEEVINEIWDYLEPKLNETV